MPAHCRAVPGLGVDLQAPAKRLEAIAKIEQPVPRRMTAWLEAAAIIPDFELKHGAGDVQVYERLDAGTGVFGDILKCLGTAEIHGALDLGREPSDICTAEANRTRLPPGACGQGGIQPLVDQ